MKLIIKYIFTICTLLLLFSCSEDLVDKKVTATINGKVVKKGTNTPLANVKVYTSPTTQAVFSDSNGNFVFENIPIGEYSVKAELTGYITSFQGINITDGSETVSIVFELADDNSLNSPPSVPQLISPADNTEDLPTSVTLTWSATDADTIDVLKYRLILKNSLNSNIVEIPDLTVENYTLDDLTYGVSYIWQIAVSDGINPEVYSAVNQFKISSTPTNRFHYVKKSGSNYYIKSSDENGADFDFTPTTTNSWRPRLNNNANQIAFLRTSAGNPQIFVANRDGSNPQQVTSVPVTGYNLTELDFSWSTNGAQFIYPNYNKLYRINKDGTGLTLLYTTTDGNFITECDWSHDGSKIVLKTNDAGGYNVKIYIIDLLGNTLKSIQSGLNGAAGGINLSIDGNQLLYTRDVSGYENADQRQLNTQIFIYNLTNDTQFNLSVESNKPNGTNDLDARFSPNNAEIICVNTSNDGISQKDIIVIKNTGISNYVRETLFTDAEMPDYE